MSECSKGWTGRCSAAKSKKCKCSCGGENHGSTRQKVEDDSPRRSSDEEMYYAWDEKPNRQFLPSSSGMKAVRFFRLRNGQPRGEARVTLVYGNPSDEEEIVLPHRYQRHSPDGFEFGYGGSGPAEAALNLLARFIGPKNASENGLYQDFKWAFIATIDQEKGGKIYGDSIREWVRSKWREMAEVDELNRSLEAVGEPGNVRVAKHRQFTPAELIEGAKRLGELS